MKKSYLLSVLVPILAAAPAVAADTLVVTASNNATRNQLMVYNTSGKLIQVVPTGGQGGVSGNAGGIQAMGDLVAVVNFGSNSVSLFARAIGGFEMTQSVPTTSSPVSVAFGNNHLYILGTTKVESHRMFGPIVSPSPDGVAGLVTADGSSGQVGFLQTQLIVTEKSNMIETVNLTPDGAVNGGATQVQGIPSNVNTPFGLVTSGDNAYVTIAHADETSLVRNGKVLTTTTSVAGANGPHSPCWLTLEGPFVFSSNSPSKNISRYAVYGQKIVQDAAVAATVGGAPTDIASGAGLVAVLDGNGTLSHVSIFSVDEDGNLTLAQPAATISGAANGVAVVTGGN